jgi:hypothetical protein
MHALLQAYEDTWTTNAHRPAGRAAAAASKQQEDRRTCSRSYPSLISMRSHRSTTQPNPHELLAYLIP